MMKKIVSTRVSTRTTLNAHRRFVALPLVERRFSPAITHIYNRHVLPSSLQQQQRCFSHNLVHKMDPLMQLYLESEKYAPKNARQLEDRILDLETTYAKKGESMNTSKKMKVLDELVQKSCELGDFRRAEKHCKVLCEEADIAYGKYSVQASKAFRLLAELQFNKLFKQKEAVRTQKVVVDIESNLLSDLKTSTADKKKIRDQVYSLGKALDLLGVMYRKTGSLQESLDMHSSAVQNYESCFVMKRVPLPKDKSFLTKKEIKEIRAKERREMEQMIKMPIPADDDDLDELPDIAEDVLVVDEEKTAVPLEYIQSLINKGNLLYELEKYQDCYYTLSEVRRLQYTFLESASKDAYDALVQVYMTLGNACIKFYSGVDVSFTTLDEKAQEAEIIFKKAVEFAKLAFGDQDDRVGSLLYSLGILYSQRQNFDLAEKYTKEALTIFEKRSIDTDIEEEQAASEDVEKEIMKQIEEHRIETINNATNMDITRLSRRWTELAKCYLTLATLYFKTKIPQTDAQMHTYLGIAEKYFRKSLHIHNAITHMFFANKENSGMSKTLYSLKYDTAFIFNNLGILQNQRGDKLEAIAMFEKAYDIGKSLIEPSADGKPTSNYVIASSLLHLGNHFMFTMKDIEKAYEYLKESFAAYNTAFQYEYHVDLADVCIGLGRIHLDWKKFKDAKRNFEQARNILMAYSHCMDDRLDLVHGMLQDASKQLAKLYNDEQREIDEGKLVLSNTEMQNRISEMEHEHNMDKENYAKRKMLEAKREEEIERMNKQHKK